MTNPDTSVSQRCRRVVESHDKGRSGEKRTCMRPVHQDGLCYECARRIYFLGEELEVVKARPPP